MNVDEKYYSPIPDFEFLKENSSILLRSFTEFNSLVDWGECEQRLNIIVKYKEEWKDFLRDRPLDFEENPRYYSRNNMYGRKSAIVLYSFIRHLCPRYIVELGSGYSSLIMIDALNMCQHQFTSINHIDWKIPQFVKDSKRKGIQSDFIEQNIINANRSDLGYHQLGKGALIFIDTSHTSKTGGELNRIVLEYLPSLKPGVLVHFHDIFLPYEYPEEWVLKKERGWNEQYLILAFLLNNAKWKVVFPEAFLNSNSRRYNDIFIDDSEFIDNYYSSSLWIQKIA